MKIDMKNFRDLTTPIPKKGDLCLNFPNSTCKTPRIHINVETAKFFKAIGVKRVKPLISKDNSMLVLVDSGNDGVSVGNGNCGLSYKYLTDMFKGIAGKNDGVRFVGVPDEKEKNVSFDLTKPVFY